MKDKEEQFDRLLATVRELVTSPARLDDKLMAICRLLRDDVAHYDWVGFYFVDDSKQNLLLGPYVGEPTRHTKIPIGQGICGRAAEREETSIVQDVSRESNYLACSPKVKSEIVIPFFKGDQMVGELDLDSHTLAPFTQEDQTFLEDVCRIVSQLF